VPIKSTKIKGGSYFYVLNEGGIENIEMTFAFPASYIGTEWLNEVYMGNFCAQ